MQGFKRRGWAQRFLSVHAATYNTFNVQRHLISARTHRTFRAKAMDTCPLLQHEHNRQRDRSRLSFDNVTMPTKHIQLHAVVIVGICQPKSLPPMRICALLVQSLRKKAPCEA